MGLARLLLAAVVAGDHFFLNVLSPHGFGPRGVDQFVWLNAGFAVMLFYVISGFLISFVLASKYTEPFAFYRSRFIRIFSLYWPLLAVVVLIFPPDGRQDLLDHLSAVTIFGGDWLTALRHNPFPGTLGPAWSIATELTFYAVAPFVLRSLGVTLALFAASLGLRFWLQGVEGLPLVWLYQFPPVALWCFLSGDLARRAAERWAPVKDIWPLFLLMSVFALRQTMNTGSLVSPWFVVMILAFALTLPGLFAATKDNRAMNALGDLSYPLYLVHLSVMLAIFVPIAPQFLAGRDVDGAILLVAGFGVACIVASIAAHFVLEKPTAHIMRALADLRYSSGAVKTPLD